MDVKEACDLSRFSQAGRYDEEGNFWLVEWDFFCDTKILIEKDTRKKIPLGMGLVIQYEDWQPVAPKQ